MGVEVADVEPGLNREKFCARRRLKTAKASNGAMCENTLGMEVLRCQVRSNGVIRYTAK